MVVKRASCLRRGRRSICSMRRKSLRLGWCMARPRRASILKQFLDGDIESRSEAESHLCGEPQLAMLVIGNHHLDRTDAASQFTLAVAALSSRS